MQEEQEERTDEPTIVDDEPKVLTWGEYAALLRDPWVFRGGQGKHARGRRPARNARAKRASRQRMARASRKANRQP